MSQVTEPAATPSAAETPAAPATTTDAKAPEPAKPAGIDPSEAGRILARARAKHGLPPKAEAPPSPAPKPDEPAKPAETPPAPKPDDDEAARLAALVREDRRLRTERQKLEAEAASFAEAKASHAAVAQARALREKGDWAGAIKALFPDVDPHEDVFFALLRAGAASAEGGEEKPPVDVEAVVAKQLEAREAERVRLAQERAQAEMSAARDGYAKACAEELAQHAADFPLVRAWGFGVEEMEAYVVAVRRQTGQVPEPLEVLKHFEGVRAGRLKGSRYEPRPDAPPAPAATVTGDWARAAAAPAGSAPPPKTVEEKRVELKARLRALRTA